MRYILYSPPHTKVREQFTRTNGEVVPREEFKVDARALYSHKQFPNRRYRKGFHNIDPAMKLVKCKTYEEAKDEQEALKNYCGEVFEIRQFVKGQLGAKMEESST